MSLTSSSANRKDISTARHGVKLEHHHFSFIASVICHLPPEYREEVALAFDVACHSTNPRFDSLRFLTACDGEAE